ncbi:hypothetical protein CFIO01_12000 [Colletotrichum fioriniae PJ7]|uniref:Endonuclease/exonuclease/phosphatase domain-containing protein n=1 Tax=Colletotrichum fioriniae PJ7 TaxID=1445577 RepID=A0A010RLW8_9PEZI|nr:hypothetical protein CFIO01_12000 [Colletotrichum fioriniae PJ7]
MSWSATQQDAERLAPVAQSWHQYELTTNSWEIVKNHDVDSPPPIVPQDTTESSPRFVLATWNVEAFDREPARRITSILDQLLNHSPSPDVIFFQEVSITMLSALLNNSTIRDNWYSSEKDSQNWIGAPLAAFATITFLSKAKFGHFGRVALASLGRVSRIKYRSFYRRDALCSEVFVPSRQPGTQTITYKRLQLVNVHLDSLSNGAACRPAQLQCVGSLLHEVGHGLVAGDFNPVTPHIDASLVEDNDLLDAWKELKGEENGYTWGVNGTERFPANRMDKVATVGLRPLHIEVLHPMQVLLPGEDGSVPWSDHSGLKCTFTLASP